MIAIYNHDNGVNVVRHEEKNVTIEQWRNHYRRDLVKRSKNSPFSRLQGKTMDPVTIVKRGAWDSNPIFSRCPECGSLVKFGICNNCNFVRVCSICRNVIQADGSVLPFPYDEEKDRVSHGFCKTCLKRDYPDMYRVIVAKRAAS